MAALLVVITILTSICCCKSITCRDGGRQGAGGRFCYCRPGLDGRNCEKKVTNWTKNKKASQSSIYASYALADKAINGLLLDASMTRLERYPWWRVHLRVILKVRGVQVLPDVPKYHHGFHSYTMSSRVMVGVTSTGRYTLCDDVVERHDCKGAVGYLVVISTALSTSEITFLALSEVMVYGKRSSATPCLSNPCGNGGSCKPKDTYFHRCVCPPTWPGLNCEGKNWARGQTATISGPNGTVITASNTVDGNRDDVMRLGRNTDNLCVTTARDVTSPWWKVELETAIEVIQVYMVTRVESRTTDLLHCDIYVGPHNGTYSKYYDHSRDNNTPSGAESYAWFYVWCLPISIGSTVKIKYTYRHTSFESSFYAILSLCEVEVYGRLPPCASNPCNNGGSCRLIQNTVSVWSYECSCPINWIGSNCEDMSPCTSNPCDNGGSCRLIDHNVSFWSYECLCPFNWIGSNCEDIVPCTSNPCDNGGICKGNGTSYTCIQRKVSDPCASNPCNNGGTCQLINNTGNKTSHECSSPANSTGSHRETTDSCTNNPCDNGGTCKLNDTSYACFCPAAWSGTNCERTKEEKKLSFLKKMLIGGGIVAVGAGAAVSCAACFSSVVTAHSGDIVARCLGIVALKTIRKRLAEKASATLGYDEEVVGEEDEEEDEEYSIWDDVYRSLSSLVYGKEEVGDAVKASASDRQCA